MLRYASLCFALLRFASLCFALLRFASLCFALLRFASLCFAPKKEGDPRKRNKHHVRGAPRRTPMFFRCFFCRSTFFNLFSKYPAHRHPENRFELFTKSRRSSYSARKGLNNTTQLVLEQFGRTHFGCPFVLILTDLVPFWLTKSHIPNSELTCS